MFKSGVTNSGSSNKGRSNLNQSSESLLAGALGDARIVLQTAARHRRVLTYADLAREASTAFDLGPSSPELARILCELLVDDA